MSRQGRSEQAAQTLHIVERGLYFGKNGTRVDLRPDLREAQRRTRYYAAVETLPTPDPGKHPTQFRVVNDTTLAALLELTDRGFNPVALNFASATRPGGGWLSGAEAQEEHLCRSSALESCLRGQPAYFRPPRSSLYESWVIYSPAVPVFRDSHGHLLDAPWRAAFVTSPAPNQRAWLERGGELKRVTEEFSERGSRVLAVAATQGHDAVVLGAWGCGVFGCDPREVAHTWHRLLFTGPYRGVFREVVFAVLDSTPTHHSLSAFQTQFPEAEI